MWPGGAFTLHTCDTAFTAPRWRTTRVFAKLADMSATSPLPQRLFHGASWNALLVACAMGWTMDSAHAAPETWRFDPIHSQVWFSADHEHFSHPLGRLRIKDGWFQFDASDWSASRVDVVIDLISADMGDAKWSDTVKSAQFLDTGRWPSAHFVSRSVERKGAMSGVIHGELTLHGATQPVDVAFTLNRIGTDPYSFKRKAGFSATARLHRSAFGMNRYADVVGEDIPLRFEIESIRDRDAARPIPPAQP
jgi:polyisoprenoid-binding protein YceI